MAMELGPDDFSDERSVQIVECRGCGFVGVGLYEESRRGSGERVHHAAYDTTVTPMYQSTIRECPTPRQAGCRCFAHQLMRRSVGDPLWRKTPLPMRRVSPAG